MTDGYIYCFSNPSMPNILKIGMTERTPDIRLKEANNADTWKPPTPYKIEFAKKVINPKQKETTLHSLLSKYTIRTNPKREFFQVSIEEVKIFFDLIDGELWINDKKEELKVEPKVEVKEELKVEPKEELKEEPKEEPKEELKVEPKEEIKEEIKMEDKTKKVERIKILINSYEILNEYELVYTINHKHLLKILSKIINDKTNIEFNKYYYKCLSLFNIEYYHYKEDILDNNTNLKYLLYNFKDHNLLHLYNTPDEFINELSNIDNHKFTSIFHIHFKNFIENKIIIINTPPKKSIITSYDMSKYFTDGQKIKHTFNNNKTWIGIFNLSNNAIIHDKNIYKSLSSFALSHYKNEKSSRISVNGWNECYCEINKKWVKTINIREIDLKRLPTNS